MNLKIDLKMELSYQLFHMFRMPYDIHLYIMYVHEYSGKSNALVYLKISDILSYITAPPKTIRYIKKKKKKKKKKTIRYISRFDILRQIFHFKQVGYCVDSKTINSSVQPKPQYILKCKKTTELSTLSSDDVLVQCSSRY